MFVPGDETHRQVVKTCRLINKLSIEGNTHGAEEKTGVLVGSGSCMDRDVSTGDHLWWVPTRKKCVSLRVTANRLRDHISTYMS